MAQYNGKKRSLLLCQLIHDRNIDDEVNAAIRKLLVEGVDVNIQDLNRNKNTPIHLATQNSDKIGLRFLLKFKPDLQIRNGNGESPFDIAQSIELKELLSSASLDAGENKFVREIEFNDLCLERLKWLESDAAFKVLKITCCPKAQTVWERLNQDDYRSAITKSSHLFVIAIESQEEENENFLPQPVDITRPMIIQITSNVTKKSSIYYKEECSKQLVEIKFDAPIDKHDFLRRIRSGTGCNFSLLVQALHSNIFGSLSGSLLDVKLNNDKDRTEIVNGFIATNALCHRFFKLFDERLTEDELNARVNQTLTFPGDQSLLALLDLPFEFKDEVELAEDQKRILSFVESRNYNLMMLAIECNNRDVVKILLRFPIDLDHLASDNRWASDLCWEKQNWEILAELISAGSPYPKNFDASLPSLATSTAFARIKSTIAAATSFHETIQREAIDEVKLFIENNPKMKQVYDRTNKSALTTALEYDGSEIYSLLLSEGFTPGVDDEYEKALNNCNVKEEIRDKNREYFKNAFDEPHLKRLLYKYKLSFSSTNREACSQVIQKMFLKLNEIPEMVPILQIVSCSEQLKIVFDFDCHSVQKMDPTVGSSTKGLVYPFTGFIYVGAKNYHTEFFQVIGTLAHELTHYAMELTYENDCKPYAIDDEANQEIFKSIVVETRTLVQADTSTDSIISSVFTCYKQEVWHQELIVRVPHLLARYKNSSQALVEVRHKNHRLFNFFRSKVLPDIKSKSKVWMHKLEVRKINSRTGLIEKIKKHEVQFKKRDIKLKDQIIGSNAPQLTLGMLRQSLDESSHVFISIDQIAYGNICERVCKLEEKDSAIVVDCTEMVQNHVEIICNIRNIFKNSGKIFLVMTAKEASIMSLKLTKFEMTPINHSWSDLTDDSQDILLQKQVNFQGASCSLKNLTNKLSIALLELPLNEFCNSENFKIGNPLSLPLNKFYHPRNFITRIPKPRPKQLNKDDQLDVDTHSNSRPQIEKRMSKSSFKKVEGIKESEQFETIERTLREILVESKNQTVAIISDSAGTGKTSALHEIARTLNESDPTRWTILTDLKQHFGVLEKIRDIKTFQDFVTQIILADKSIFEKKFFAQFHQEGRTNVLLDGFDEISPHYKNEILKALRLFTPKSGNQLWITTRSHLEMELEKTLDQLSCCLQPLTREAQIEFLGKVWKSNKNSNALNTQENLAIIAKDLLNELSLICDSKSSFIGLPILISMLAEIYHYPEKSIANQQEKLSFYSIFKQFIEKNIDGLNNKGEIAEAERREILKQSEGILEVHRKIAIAHFFENEVSDVDFNYDNEQWTVEKLTRLGLIRYDESKESLSFIHETFAEYFLTDFIVENSKTKTRACGAVKILVKVLTEKDFQVVRLFLDQASKELNFTGDKKLCENVGKQLDVMRDEALRVLLHISKESCEEVFKFMLNSIEHVGNPILLINERDEEGNNVLLINVELNSKTMIKTLFDFLEQKPNLVNARKTIRTLSAKKLNVFHKVAYNKHDEIYPTLYECIQKILKTEEIKKMLRAKSIEEWSVLQHAAAICTENALNDLVRILKLFFDNVEMKDMLFEVNKQDDNVLHVAVKKNNKFALKSFFEHVEEILNFEETKKMVQQKGFKQRNIFHSVCEKKNTEIFLTLIECAIKFLEKQEIKTILREKTLREWSVLHFAAAFCNETALNDLMKIFKEIFSIEEIKEILFEVNKYGNNSLHVALQRNNKIVIKSFFQHLNEILNVEEAKELMQQSGFERKNIFHSACFNVNKAIFPTLYKCSVKLLGIHEITKMLREKDENKRSVLHSAAANCNGSALNDLVKMLKEFFRIEEMKEMLFEFDKYGMNSLHALVRQNNKIALKSFIKHLNEIVNLEETKCLIQQRGFEGREIFHFACENENDEIFPTLHEFAIKYLEEHEIRRMLKGKGTGRWNVLQFASRNCNESALDDLVIILKRYYNNEEMKEMEGSIYRNGLIGFKIVLKGHSWIFILTVIAAVIAVIEIILLSVSLIGTEHELLESILLSAISLLLLLVLICLLLIIWIEGKRYILKSKLRLRQSGEKMEGSIYRNRNGLRRYQIVLPIIIIILLSVSLIWIWSIWMRTHQLYYKSIIFLVCILVLIFLLLLILIERRRNIIQSKFRLRQSGEEIGLMMSPVAR